jgi:hypothetical protein
LPCFLNAVLCFNPLQVTPVKDQSVSFYVSLAKRALLVNQTLELSGIGTAMATTVSISEVLHNAGVATRTRTCTSLVSVPAEVGKGPDGFGNLALGNEGKLVSRPKIQIWMQASAGFEKQDHDPRE